MKDKILELLEQRRYSEIAAAMKDMNPADAAALLEERPDQSKPLVFRLFPKELAAEALSLIHILFQPSYPGLPHGGGGEQIPRPAHLQG